jgi:ABC-2 type transport system ATP-binding protein
MLQRIGIAQALVNDPEIVFLDEPMSGLDPIGRRDVRDVMLALRAKGKTVFFSSHILSDVEALCDRVAILNRGHLVRSGTLSEITSTGEGAMDMVATGLDGEALLRLKQDPGSFEIASATHNAVHLIVRSEAAIAETISKIKMAGGTLVSVNPRRASLEDLFTDDASRGLQ